MTAREKIMAFLKSSDQPQDSHAVLAATLLPTGTVSGMLHMMSSSDQIVRRPNPFGRGHLYWDRPFEVDAVDRKVTTRATRAAANAQVNGDESGEGRELPDEQLGVFAREYADRMKALGRRDEGWPDTYRPDIIDTEGSRARERQDQRRKRFDPPTETPFPAASAAFHKSAKLPETLPAPVGLPTPTVEVRYPPRDLVVPPGLARTTVRETVIAQRETVTEAIPPGPQRTEFPIPGKSPAALEVPYGFDADDLHMLMVMLEAYGTRAFGGKAA